MRAAQYDFEIKRGATFDDKLVWRSKDKRPVNLTGYSAKMQVRAAPGSDVLLECSTANGSITLGTANGLIAFNVAPAVTAGCAWTKAQYDLFLTDANGKAFCILEGAMTVVPSITV